MPRFSPSGHDMALCQICHRDVDTGREQLEWRPEITGSESGGNVCAPCLFAHSRTKFKGDELRRYVSKNKGRASEQGPISVYEHCRRESGLEGAALQRYINRYYGHG